MAIKQSLSKGRDTKAEWALLIGRFCSKHPQPDAMYYSDVLEEDVSELAIAY